MSDAKKRIYLDYNATTPVRSEVFDGMLPYLREHFGNPTSPYFLGQETRKALEKARGQVASFLGAADPQEIVFTSCGSESDDLAVAGGAWARYEESRGKLRNIVSSPIEHDAIRLLLKQLEKRGFAATLARVDQTGFIEAGQFSELITPETALVSIMHANNEVGTIEPIEDIAIICRQQGVLFHTDAVQSAGKIPIDVKKTQIDLLSISGHKLGAPKGVGALYVRRGVKLSQVVTGHQEKNRRGGTENVASIVGLGIACELAHKEIANAGQYETLRQELITGILKIPGTHLNGNPNKCLPHCANFSFAGLDGHALVIALDIEGICVSSGPACSSGSSQSSHVLTAMGCDSSLAAGALRISMGHGTQKEDVARLLSILPQTVEKLRKVPAAI